MTSKKWPMEPAYRDFREALEAWACENSERLVDRFLATGLPMGQFALWLREQRIAEERV